MAVRKKSSVKKKSKVSTSKPIKSTVSVSLPWYKKYMGWIIGGGALYVVMLILGNLMFFRENIPSDFQVHLVQKITAMDSGSGPFLPGGIALLGNDKIAVSDTNSKRILVFNKEGKFLQFIGKELSKEDRELIKQNKKTAPVGSFLGIGGLCTVDGDKIYALDDQANIVRGFGSTYNPLEPVDYRALGCYGPHNVNYDGKQFLISDTGSHRVIGLNRDGQIQLTLGGKHGDGKGELNNPLDVAFDGKHLYYVADFDNNRIEVFNDKGKYEDVIKLGARPSSVALLQDGNVLATSNEGGFVRVFKPSGKLVGSLKEVKNEMTFTSFSCARAGPDGTIYMAGPDTVVMVKPVTKP